jgi:DUF4097 and DUF4098 domain-containing protein YvlB
VIAALGSVAPWAGCGLPSALAPLHEQTRTLTAAHQDQAPLRVETTNGSITATRSDRSDVQVVAQLRAVSAERLQSAEVVVERLQDGTLSVHVRWPDGRPRAREGCSLDVVLPGAVDVDAHTSNGQLEMQGLGGQAELRTSNGRIEVRDHAGSVTARTSNGAIDAVHIQGPVDLESSNGAITVAAVSGPVSVRTSNGHIEIALAPDGIGPVNARTSNGTLNLRLGSAFEGELVARTSNGLVRIEQLSHAQVTHHGQSSAVLVFGDSDQKSTLTSTNGSISIAGPAPRNVERPDEGERRP